MQLLPSTVWPTKAHIDHTICSIMHEQPMYTNQ
jgi:hypothetical protein